jgi:DNA-binding LacI/PurR family transcriptional regulator
MINKISKAPTMRDIAKMAGVTQATVSYVINDSEEISETVKKRVLDAAEELGYIPNAVARNLKKRTTNTIGIIVPDVMNSYYNEMIKYTEKIIREKGFFTFICNTMHDADVENWYIISLIQQKVAGVFICYGLTNRSCYEKLHQHSVPFVDIDDESDNVKWDSPCVLVNHRKGSFLAVQHFVSLGIKEIAYISEPLYNMALRDRYEGFLQAMKEFSLEVNSDIIYIAKKDNEYEKIQLGYVATREIFSRAKPKGIFAATDQIAFGVLKRLNEMKVKIPQEIAVIGYDNVPFSSVISPSLTTINQPIRTMCIQGTSTLFKAVRREQDIKKKITLEPSIIIRESAP